MKKTILSVSLAAILVAGCTPSGEAKKDKQRGIADAIESKQYQFQARSAQPLRGRTVQLTSLYDLKVTGDSVIAFLPYFGRAYTAPIDPGEGGINFSSTDFGYRQSEPAGGGWTIEITPRDVNDTRKLLLSVSANGYSSLQVTSLNRQPISFNGNVVPLKR